MYVHGQRSSGCNSQLRDISYWHSIQENYFPGGPYAFLDHQLAFLAEDRRYLAARTIVVWLAQNRRGVGSPIPSRRCWKRTDETIRTRIDLGLARVTGYRLIRHIVTYSMSWRYLISEYGSCLSVLRLGAALWEDQLLSIFSVVVSEETLCQPFRHCRP